MNNKELVEKVGFGMAVVIREDEFDADFWENLSFEQWCEIYEAALNGSRYTSGSLYESLGKKAEIGIQKNAKSFNDWYLISKKVYSLKSESLEKMLELASSYKEWNKIFWQLGDFQLEDNEINSLFELALKEMVNSATTFDEWSMIHNNISACHSLESVVLKSMADLAKTYDQWHCISNRSSGELKNLASNNLVEVAKNSEEWLGIFFVTSNESEFENRAIIEMKQHFDFLQWEKVFKSQYSECTKVTLLEKIALEMMYKTAKSFTEWKFVLSKTEEGSLIRGVIFEKMAEVATIEDWLKIYGSFSHSSHEDQLFILMMLKKLSEK